MTQHLILYGDVKHPHVYATAYTDDDVSDQIAQCVVRHGMDVRARAIDAEKLPPSRIKN